MTTFGFFFILLPLTQVACRIYEGNFKACPGKRISENIISTTKALSPTHCATICILETNCYGFNLIQGSKVYTCELQSSNLLVASCDDDTLASATGVDFYVKGANVPDTPFVVYTMNTLGANMVREGSSRLPAPLDGYFGSGACVDAVGIPHCITLETSPSGCPYQPDQCSQGFTWSFWVKAASLTSAQNSDLLTTGNRPGLQVFYHQANTKVIVNVWMLTHAWYEHCRFGSGTNPDENILLEWTQITVSWMNISPTANTPEWRNGLKVFFNGKQLGCHSNYQSRTHNSYSEVRLGCGQNRESPLQACYDDVIAYNRSLTDAEVADLYTSAIWKQ